MFTKMIVGVALAASLFVTGCKAEEALKDLEALKKEACACKDASCVAKIQTRLSVWQKRNVETTGSKSQEDKVLTLGEEIGDCLREVISAGGPADDKE